MIPCARSTAQIGISAHAKKFLHLVSFDKLYPYIIWQEPLAKVGFLVVEIFHRLSGFGVGEYFCHPSRVGGCVVGGAKPTRVALLVGLRHLKTYLSEKPRF